MSKFYEKYRSVLSLIVAQIVLLGILAVASIFYTSTYVLYFTAWKITLIDITFALCSGAMVCLAYFERHPKTEKKYLVIPFLLGAGVFCAIFFGLQRILDIYYNRTYRGLYAVCFIASFNLACVALQDIAAGKRIPKFFLFIGALFSLGIYVITLFFSTKTFPAGWMFKYSSNDKHNFVRQSAEAYAITERDVTMGLDWLDVSLSGETAAFDFDLGGKSFRDNIEDWTITVDKRTENEIGDIAFERTFFNAEEKVSAQVIASFYRQTATIEWTVYLKNEGEEKSSVVTHFSAMDTTLPLVTPTLYFSGGSEERSDDYVLYSRELTEKEYVFDTVRGRASQVYLPFFNLTGNDLGATIGIGWAGRWTARFSSREETYVNIGQTYLRGYLDPGETIRSPLVSLCLYSGGNALKGFNNFRADIKRGLPEGYQDSNLMMFAGAEGQDGELMANAEGTATYIEALREAGVLDGLDYAWYDASWYDMSGCKSWRDAIGDWNVDTTKYPDGLGAVSDYLKENGVGMLVWYEPERLTPYSELFRETVNNPDRKEWLISPSGGSKDYMWNMGNDEARAFMADHIASSLEENKVSYYRQDFNFTNPKEYWERADREFYNSRGGFAENHYVAGEYAFLDALRERIPGLLIDNCASGGRRIDLEMCRRSVPLWRSDYQCKKDKDDLSEAAQLQLYGLSMWLPYSAIANPKAKTEYDLRSLIGGCMMFYADILYEAKDAYVKIVQDYNQVKGYFSQNYYPLTACTSYSRFIALQFGDENEGTILLYSRKGSEGKKTIRPNGLLLGANYTVSTIEGWQIASTSGSDLMRNGFEFNVEEEQSLFLIYKKQ